MRAALFVTCLVDTLTPSVGDANTQTPEFKAFLVNVERTAAPAA